MPKSEDFVIAEILKLSDPNAAEHCARYFKTGKGQYGYGDIFLGLSVPQIKNICAKYKDAITLPQIDSLLKNKYHELRFAALWLMVLKYEKASEDLKAHIVSIYLKNTKHINNWDLVDVAAYKILGRHCFENKNYDILYDFAGSSLLWERRIAVVANLFLIKQGVSKPLLDLCQKLLCDEEDLMHKACGWMLRELGKVSKPKLLLFLKKYHKKMPRVMFRYAIERLEKSEIEGLI